MNSRKAGVDHSFIATVGLGVSDFGYRIFALLVSVVSCMDSVHEHGHSEREARDSVP